MCSIPESLSEQDKVSTQDKVVSELVLVSVVVEHRKYMSIDKIQPSYSYYLTQNLPPLVHSILLSLLLVL